MSHFQVSQDLDVVWKEEEPVWIVVTQTNFERTDNQCRPDVRVCSPLLLYLFINPCTPTCSLAFSLDFLKSYLSFRTYSRRVSRQGATGPFHYPPPHLKRPRLRST